MNKTALVTGASRGIGRAIALQLAADGYHIIAHYNKSETQAKILQKEIIEIGQKCTIYKADFNNINEIQEMFTLIIQEHKNIDLLINNVGFDYGKLIEDYSLAEMKEVIDITLLSKITVTKLALPLLKNSKQSQIINIASRMGGYKTIKTVGAYAPAEAGVIKWTQCCALEFAKYGIKSNCVAPGLTDTDLSRSVLTDEEFKIAAKNNPLKRVAKPEDIANVVSFLASSKASYINGETIGVNGGSNLG